MRTFKHFPDSPSPRFPLVEPLAVADKPTNQNARKTFVLFHAANRIYRFQPIGCCMGKNQSWMNTNCIIELEKS